MSLHLKFAHDATLLLDGFAEALRDAWRGNPMVSPAVVAPSPSTAKWLKLSLADRYGCLLNMDVYSLESYLWQSLVPDQDMAMLHKGSLQNVVAALLTPERLARPEYGPVQSYLADSSENGIDPAKRVQLSSEIARLLLEYEYNRPSVWDRGSADRAKGWRVRGVDFTWDSGAEYFAPRLAQGGAPERVREHEAWQRALYRELFARGGPLDPDAGQNSGRTRHLSLPRLYRMRHEQHGGFPASALNTVRPLFLPLVSKVSHFHRNVLLEISESVELWVYLVNPCSEFWEDVDTTRGHRARRSWRCDGGSTDAPISRMSSAEYEREELDGAGNASEHRLLELWGHAGKENITLWCQASDYTFDFVAGEAGEVEPTTRLAALQRGLLLRDDSVRPRSGDQDRSLRILAAPEPGREVEALRDNILSLMAGTRPDEFRLDEVAVYLPDPSRYIPFIEKIFGALAPFDPGFIPYTVLGTDGGVSLYSRAVRSLLSLCSGSFNRAEVFDLLRNPLVIERLGISRGELDTWESWAANINATRGFDAEHRREMGDHAAAAADSHTFLAGIARMLLGQLASEPVPLGMKLGGGPGDIGVAPYRDFETSDSAMVERFCGALTRLAHECRGLKALFGRESPPGDLVQAFLDLTDRWITVIEAGEGRARADFRTSLADLTLQHDCCGRETIGFDEFRQWATESLREELPGSSSAWSGVLTFAPLRPGNVLPHRYVFVLGLDGDTFPGVNTRTPLDLLSARRIIGDSDKVRDNRYAFLELVCSAGEQLTLSFRAQDIQKDRPLQPSSVVLELASACGLPLPDMDRDPANPDCLPLVAHECGAEQVIWDPAAALLAALGRIVTEGGAGARARNRLPGLAPVPAAASDTRLRTTVFDIRKFLDNPLEYHLTRGLGLRDEDAAETTTATDEPLESEFLVRYGVKQEVLADLFRAAYPRDGIGVKDEFALAGLGREMVERRFDKLRTANRAPEAAFGEIEVAALRTWAETAARTVAAVAARCPEHRLHTDTDLRLADDGTYSEFVLETDGSEPIAIEVTAPIVLKPMDEDQELVLVSLGTDMAGDDAVAQDLVLWLLAFLFRLDRDCTVETVVVQHVNGAERIRDWWLYDPSQDHLSEPADDDADGENSPAPAGAVCTEETDGDGQAWSPDRARRWLREVVGDMLKRRCCEHLPGVHACSGLLASHAQSADAVVGEAVKEAIDKDATAWSPAYRPRTATLALTEPRAVEESGALGALVKKRYGPVAKGRFYGDHD